MVLAAVEAACTDAWNVHGVLATTMPVGPVLIVNGPVRRALGMNTGINVFGQGNRANATIGRALQLVVRNVGGGRPGEVDRATFGNPGKLSFCFAGGRGGLALGAALGRPRGCRAGSRTVTLFAGEGPRSIVDQLSRDPESLARIVRGEPAHAPPSEAAARLRLHPRHRPRARARVPRSGLEQGRSCTRGCASCSRSPAREVVRGAGGIAEGLPESVAGATLPKFRPGGLLIVHCGGGAGLFSAMIGGWASGRDRQPARDPGGRAMTKQAEGSAPARVVLDPTSERAPGVRARLPRLATLAGATVGLLDISKARGDVFLDRLAAAPHASAGATVLRFRKPTFTKPAPVDLRQEIATRCDAVIEALAD